MIQPCRRLTEREQFGDYLNELGLTGIAVEVGTATGDFAEPLLQTWKGRKLFCIDPYIANLPGYKDKGVEQCEEWGRVARERLAVFGTRVEFIQEKSLDAVDRFSPNSLDFVYIDADHYRLAEDLPVWAPKVRTGGIVAGHDINGRWEPYIRPVVERYATDLDTQVYRVPGNEQRGWFGALDSWYFFQV